MNIKPKYCKKHDHTYFGFLNECPICVGERRGKEIKRRMKNGTYHPIKKST